MATRFRLPFEEVGAGISPANGAQLFFFATGTTNDLDVWAEASEDTVLENPVVANQVGRFPAIFARGTYRIVLQDKNNKQIWEEDPVIYNDGLNSSDNLTDLRALVGQQDGEVITLLGHTVKGDGGGGDFWFDLSSSDSDDNGVTIMPDSGAGRWLRLDKSPIHIKYYGSRADGLNDDAALIAAAFNYGAANNHQVVADPNDVYLITGDGVLLPSNLDLDSRGAIFRNVGAVTNTFCFRVQRTSNDISIINSIFQGPYHDGTTVATVVEWNTGISVFGAFYRDFDPVTNALRPVPLSFAEPSTNIKINDCEFNGWALNGVQADDITDFQFLNNRVYHCGRDGIRCYGIWDGSISNNNVRDMAPGLGGVAPNLNVYGITLTRRFNTPESEYRRTERVVVNGNVVNGCYTWKSLDTHGALDCVFDSNVVNDSHIGVGVAQGQSDGSITSDNTIISNNVINFVNNPTTIPRAGITVFAGTLGTGKNCNIQGNTIMGYGVDIGDGAISVSRQEGCNISNNTIINSLKAAITVIEPSSVSITGNYIKDVRTDSALQNIGISIQDTDVNAYISGNTFHAVTGSLDGISLPIPAAGFTVNVSSDNNYINVDAEVLQPNRINAGSYQTQTRGSANINNDGATASIVNKTGSIDTVTRIATGIVEVTSTFTFFSIETMYPKCFSKSAVPVIYGIGLNNETTFTVQTKDEAGVLFDTGFLLELDGY